MNTFRTTAFDAVRAVSAVEKDMPSSKNIKKSTDDASDDSSNVPEEPNPSDEPVADKRIVNNGIPRDEFKLASNVLYELERLIVSDDWTLAPTTNKTDSSNQSNPSSKKHLPKLDDLGRTIVTSYSLQSYIKLLPRQHSKAIADHVYNTTNDALSHLFRFPDASTRFHETFYTGFDIAYKVAREHSTKSDKNLDQIVFLSPGLTSTDLPDYFRTELGVNDVRWLPASSTPLATVDSRLDVSAFETQLEQDVQLRKTPVLVVAVVGSFFFGHNDLVSKLVDLRSRYHFWLHLVGLNLAALITSDAQPNLLTVLQSTDSFTVPLGSWLGIPGLPHLTIYKKHSSISNSNGPENPNLVKAESLEQKKFHRRLNSLPWWIVVNELGSASLKKRIDTSYALIKAMLKCLSSFDGRVEVLGLAGASTKSIVDKIEKKSITPPAVLTFKYTPVLPNSKIYLSDSERSTALESFGSEYLDCMNIWLGQGLIHDCPWLGLQIVDLSKAHLGTALRYCPLESSAHHRVDVDKMDVFKKRFGSMLDILDVTVKCKLRLPMMLKSYPELAAVTVPKWAGATGLVYLPSMMRQIEETNSESTTSQDKIVDWTEQQKEQVSHLNIELVRALKDADSAFSLGESQEGVKCVKFGMLADERDLLELIKLVSEKGKEIEQSSQYMESLAEMVRLGIEAANEDLKKETEQRLISEGILRQVPLVGSMLNWWSPLPKEQVDVRGRAFDLVTGRIFPTSAANMHNTSSATDHSEQEESHTREEDSEEEQDEEEEETTDSAPAELVNGHVDIPK